MRVDWALVRSHVLWYSLVGGGATSLVVYAVARWISYPVELTALLVSMAAVGGLVTILRDGGGSGGPSSGRSVSIFGGTGVGGPDPDERSPSRDRAAIYYLAGVLAFAVVVALGSLVLG